MKYFLRMSIVFAILSVPGCAWFAGKPESSLTATQFVQTGKIVDEALLSRGGKVLVVPFTAGENVEATEELDMVSLRLVKGISDGFQHSGKFTVIPPNDIQQADFIIEGHITDFSRTSRISKWILMRNKIKLSVSGRMYERETGRTAALFSDARESKKKKDDYKVLGNIIGQDISQFILSGS